MGPASNFAVPEFALGTGHRFKVSASAVGRRDSPFACPMGLALGARNAAGSLRPVEPVRASRNDRAATLNFAVQRALPALLNGRSARQVADDEPDLTHSQRRFLRHAADVLPDLLDEAGAAAGVPYRLGEKILGRAENGALRGTVTVWALHLQGTSDTGPVHEAVQLRLRPLRPPRDDDRDFVAVAAVALATDLDVPDDARLRISEFSVVDGDLRCHFDGSRADAIGLLRDRGQPLWDALDGTVFRPGAACSGCAFLSSCPAVPARPGVLGVPAGAALRRLAASDLASYARCPTAYRVRADHLSPRYADEADPGTASAGRERGLAVHSYLAWAHSREPARACDPADLPDPGSAAADDAATAAGLDRDAYRVAHPFLISHVPHCPVRHEDLGGWAAERTVAVHDPEAAAVVISTPDLACRVVDTDEPVWRETKTSGHLPADLPAALRSYPDFALDVVLLADQAARQGGAAHAELEVLTPTGATIFTVSSDDTASVAAARERVVDLAGSFVTDTEFARRPSGACVNCEAHGWCDPPDDLIRARPAAAAADDPPPF